MFPTLSFILNLTSCKLSNFQKNDCLGHDEFMIAMHLIKQKSAGEEIQPHDEVD